MATEAETVRPLAVAGDVEVPVLLVTDKDRPVDPVIWGDEKRMKRELMAWAKAVASMALNVSSAPAPRASMAHGTKCTA
ncbi:hypothetical protein D1007_01445 [Hordeum vulgare]|uniref:Uncharacterized protein n=1 Tax=Hordeum vulgare subsp. vulgare TaxID=112509 RepID=A0A8I6Z2N3_HORVV|nr:hypothetical protein D1007_01445 [Hordeum vulgare]KAI4966966.1 hypothetical protein ZWY2020_034637 [Hordeum vulgare]KAI4976138.1 hypothetical protein ZWY2020_049745 [Hordeum vulgare]